MTQSENSKNNATHPFTINLKDVNATDIQLVGGKNASTGEMIQNLTRAGILVPGGFATTVPAYKAFLAQSGLDKKIAAILASKNLSQMKILNKTSQQIRDWIIQTPFLPEFEKEIAAAYKKLKNPTVAVRSSAIAEDSKTASFAGAQDTFLNIQGIKNLLKAIKLVYASLFTSRAISYRYNNDFDFMHLGLSVGVQTMVRSDKGVSGVIFTLDTESGFDKVVLISASYGLGEAIVQGQINPDEFTLYKPSLLQKKSAILHRKLGSKAFKSIYTLSKNPHDSIKLVPVKKADRLRFCLNDKDVEALARFSLLIENHYGKPMDIEWAKDGITGKIYIVQARPETVKSRDQNKNTLERYVLSKKGKVLTEGQSTGQRIGNGKASIILNPKQIHAFKAGDVLVTDMTDPDWEPIMKCASAIVTNRGGRTCHAAIIARELGIPAIVGCHNATTQIKQGEPITVSCAEGQIGYVYAGKIPFDIQQIHIKEMPKLPVKLCINLGNPDRAFASQFLPNGGVGLARLEFIISDMIGVHPSACLNYKKLPKKLRDKVLEKTGAYKNPIEYYIERLKEGIAIIAAAFDPKEVIFRFSDFKTNEYANLLGGQLYEATEENPMIGFRGASRYKDPKFSECFKLECKAFLRARNEMGLNNAQLMIPFVRTVDELRQVINLIEENGLKRGENQLKIYMMCEIPSNVLLADEFLQYVDGFSIGSNDLTQLVLGLDRDSSLVAGLFDERNEAVKIMLRQAIAACKKHGKYIGICGQGPSDHPDFAEWLMQEGIDAMSLNPDTIVETWMNLSKSAKSQ
ncbi:MAG: phosphoenolpyruvate synthase [Gammaproteobacteria bacterium]|nr:phosphoenolpyruvate synthase [Gammaproteobacteria bacterium]